jgi:hypothetical protein
MFLIAAESASTRVGYGIGYIIGLLLVAFLLMFLIAGVYYLVKRPGVPFRQVMFSRWVIGWSIGLVILGQAGNIGRKSSELDTSHTYPADTISEFMTACLEKADAIAVPRAKVEKYCTCAIIDLQKAYTFGEFKQIAIKNDKDKISKVAIPCAKKELL